jgi:hypothetical protein
MQVVVIGQHYWGKAPNRAGALREWRKQGGDPKLAHTILTFEQDDALQGVDPVWGNVSYKGAEPTVEEVAAR